MTVSLAGRMAVVVGGTSGIGRALAYGLADAGADVVATGRRKELVDEVAKEIEARGRRTLRVPSDVTDRPSLEKLRQACVSAFGRVHILVNCASKTKRVPSLEMTGEQWDDIIETNLTGTFRACQVFGRHMIAERYGRIVNIGSLASFVGLHEVAAYTASKSGVAGLTPAPAVERAVHRGVGGERAGVGERAARVERMLVDAGLAGVIVGAQHNFAWITAGGTNRIDGSREAGAGALLLGRGGRRYVLANVIEMPRIM